MPGSKRFLHPEAIKRISRLEVRARHVVEGFLSGMHRSPYFGQSVEFLQHREYVLGDDLRHVDWKVWARQDRLYVKQFEEETNLRCTMLVDISNSMQYGNGPLTKYEYACTLACSLAYLILKQQDAVGCMAFDEKIRSLITLTKTGFELDLTYFDYFNFDRRPHFYHQKLIDMIQCPTFVSISIPVWALGRDFHETSRR